MISCCVTILDGLSGFTDILIDSIKNNTKHISEIILVKIDEDVPISEETINDGLVLKKLGTNVNDKMHGHALGLHIALEHATGKYVMTCEPDLFFYPGTDEFYLDLFTGHDLAVIGITHHNATGECSTFFPYPMNMMMRRADLPGSDFLKGRLFLRPNITKHKDVESALAEEKTLVPADGKWLLQGPIPEFQHLFPNQNPECWFDIGCNMWLWNEHLKGKWISFQTIDTNLYTTAFYKSNFKYKNRASCKKLVYHQTNCVLAGEEALGMFRKAYEVSKL